MPQSTRLDNETVARYLRRLGVDDPGAPSADALRALHRAHVERVPYEVLDIQLGRTSTVEPADNVARVLRGRGGYCVQINGAFATLLTALGYDVTWHGALVQAGVTPPAPGLPSAPHLAATVELDGETWLIDPGFGDGLHDPVPLRVGRYRQGPFTMGISRSQVKPGGWRFDHDPLGSITGVDFSMARASQEDFAEWHHALCTSPASRLVRTATVMRRDADTIDNLVGCMLRRVDSGGRTVRELTTADDWYGALADVFGLRLDDVDEGERRQLWAKVRGAHEAWLASKAKAG
jgi:arylamine N-acetyltransferase